MTYGSVPAGAAPEGESGIVSANTATVMSFEADYPFSVALAANDDLELIANWQTTDCADGDFAAVMARKETAPDIHHDRDRQEATECPKAPHDTGTQALKAGDELCMAYEQDGHA